MRKSKLLPFQKEGVDMIEKFNGRCLLADEMGLGKTIQALEFVHRDKTRLPCLIIAKDKWEWKHQIHQHFGSACTVLSGTRAKRIKKLERTEFTIINYSILDHWKRVLRKHGFKTLIIDEQHFAKNEEAQRTKAIQYITKKIKTKSGKIKIIKNIIGISGTPATNRPIELFFMLNLIRPDLFPSQLKYAIRYCAATIDFRGQWDFKGASHLDELHKLLKKTLMIRRLKKDVTDLPPKKRHIIVLNPIKERDIYDEEKIILNSWFFNSNKIKDKRSRKAQQLTKTTRLKLKAAEIKVDMIIRWTEKKLKRNPKRKICLYGIHHSILNKLHKHFNSRSVVINGNTPMNKRKEIEKQFQNNKHIRVFIGNIDAAGTSITLTRSNLLCFVEFDWVPGNHIQVEDRIHRITQGKTAHIVYFVAKDTIEEIICKMIQKKQKNLDAMFDGAERDEESSLSIHSALTEMLRKGNLK